MVDREPPTGAADAPPPADTLGELLRRARLEQDLTVEQLSTELRIEAKHLRALEEHRFEEIGVPVFVKGYLKQYGLRLGVDVSDLLALYYKQVTLPDVEIQPSRTIKLRDERQITSWVLAGVVLLTVIVGLAVWWWNGGSLSGLPSIRGTEPPTPAAPSEASPAPQTAPAVTAPLPAPASAAPAAESTETVAAEREPNPEPGAEALSAVPPLPAAEPEAAADDERAAPAATIPLQFSFSAESWAEVTDARGERLLFGLSPAGRRVTVRGEPPFAVVLGNAGSVQLTVDGEPYDIPTVGRQGNLARFAVDIAEE